ncbi:hypothetical protein [Catenovulum adriaticum]|uniref:Oligosaccharide biosynthesis protein Alg14 n=1 Tax=Catenovulum adriaticum TaxID=2984846 RepID=A0ABY7AQE4_9ALTE|nr:hypothetical protein [Catenovulum sp. TS8]WAJ70977.1 hypothetical protein OLW01_04020 [Catenovulum sp. TS8]
MTKKVKPILTVVNAGGHLTQALCIMQAIPEFHLVTSVNIKADTGAKSLTVIKSSQFNPLRHFTNVFKAIGIIRKINPQAVFSTGGPICIPFALAAKLLGVKFIYLDTLSRVVEPSHTCAFLYRFRLADQIFCQWQAVANKYPRIQYHGKTFNICDHGNVPL